MCPISLLTNPFSYFIVSYDNIKTKTNKSSDEEEYASPLIREDGRPAGREAERLSEGRNAEGSRTMVLAPKQYTVLPATAFSHLLIIEDLNLQTFFHTLSYFLQDIWLLMDIH